jgi:hypothetical protein
MKRVILARDGIVYEKAVGVPAWERSIGSGLSEVTIHFPAVSAIAVVGGFLEISNPEQAHAYALAG